MKYLEAEDMLLIYERILVEFGGAGGIRLQAQTDEIVECMLRIEDKSLKVKQIAQWLKSHSLKEKKKVKNGQGDR
jgi:prophage maintenance system killer protein